MIMDNNNGRMRGLNSEKKREPLFRFKDGSERMVFKVKDSEYTRVLVGKMKERGGIFGDTSNNKFRSTSKNSSGLRIAATQKSTGLVGIQNEGSIAERTSREFGSKRGEFAIKKNKESFRFKTQEYSGLNSGAVRPQRPLEFKLDLGTGFRDTKLHNLRVKLNDNKKSTIFDDANLRHSIRPTREDRKPPSSNFQSVLVQESQTYNSLEPSWIGQKKQPELRNFSVVPKRPLPDHSVSQEMKDRLNKNDPLKSVLSRNQKFIDGIECYETCQQLGKGAYAKVNLVKNTVDGKLYALKTYIKKDYLTKPQRFENLNNEVEIMCQVNHASIIRLEHVCETPEKVASSDSGPPHPRVWVQLHAGRVPPDSAGRTAE